MRPLSNFPQTIKTPRLVLRTLSPTMENAKMLFDVINANRDYLMAWQGHFGEIQTVADACAYLEKRAKQIVANAGVCFYIFRDNKLIGRIRFFDVRDNGCEIGYWLAKSANGRGFMTGALTALESELFKFGFEKIKLDIDDGNAPSTRLAERNGYKFETRLPMASWARAVGKCDSLFYMKYKN